MFVCSNAARQCRRFDFDKQFTSSKQISILVLRCDKENTVDFRNSLNSVDVHSLYRRQELAFFRT